MLPSFPLMRERLFLNGCEDAQLLTVGDNVQLRRAHGVGEAKENRWLPLIADGQVWFVPPARMSLDERLYRWMGPVHRVIG
jgi:hypothetical protein